jgi:hypothetical protein
MSPGSVYDRTPKVPNKPKFKVYSNTVSPVEANMHSRNLTQVHVVSGFACMPSGFTFQVTPGKVLLKTGKSVSRYFVEGITYTISQVAPIPKSVEYVIAMKLPKPGDRPTLSIFKRNALKPIDSSWSILFEIFLPKGASRISDGEIIYRFKDRCPAMEYGYFPEQPDGVKTSFTIPYQTLKNKFRIFVNGVEKPRTNIEEENFATYTKYTFLDGAPANGSVLFIDFMAVEP